MLFRLPLLDYGWFDSTREFWRVQSEQVLGEEPSAGLSDQFALSIFI